MTESFDAPTAETGAAPAPELRFFLPQGPALPPKRWQRKWKIAIRVGSALAGVALVAVAAVAVFQGVVATSRFTAGAAIEVDCASRSKPFAPDVGFGAPVTIMDAQSGEVYGRSTMNKFRALPSGICLAGFEIDDVPVGKLYAVTIGSYRTLASEDALAGDALLS
ncbi:hypothetical protein [Gordonia neofelifaecis]|uniref:Uncharacterized protein n=1 Tax=Gordonia neofelifaecis NRRL B-59395 TaxID=644548 RepID=F1YH27_9ACTN|nr:hypothetical protein [Gordonia neofelifaecis]EGD55942.1 hypothetical protein SCNU_06870 [Gordonia neofelifaecis NRRL B-59395]